jgi:predicted DNA-binding transcriptional regulator AlpA
MKKFIRGNKYAVRTSLADAAVDWQAPADNLIYSIEIAPDGLPTLVELPELYERAEAIWLAVRDGLISGFVHTQDGDFLPPDKMMLDRDSVNKFIKTTNERLALEKNSNLNLGTEAQSLGVVDNLLSKDEVCERLKISKATLDRYRKTGRFPEPTHENPNRWPSSLVAAYIAKRAITTARSDGSDEDIDDEDI